MANTLTDLANDLFKAADVVARELVGAIPSSTINAGTQGAAVGQTIRSHFTRDAVAVDITPSMTIPEGTDQVVDNKTMEFTKQRAVQVPWQGEEVGFVNSGAGFETIYGDQIVQAMRTLVNEAEVDLCQEIYQNASRSVGTPGTAPFQTDFDLIADARRVMVDNGAPMDDRQATMVINTLAGANLRKQAQLQSVDSAGNDILLRQGTLLDLQGFMIKESAGIRTHVKGTGTGYLVNSGALAIGDTAIPLDTGTGTIVAGDLVTFAGDTQNTYVVSSFSGGTLTIGAPGLRVAIANNAAVTILNNRTTNFALHRRAAEIAFRPPAVPSGGDAAVDVMDVQDPMSGLIFRVFDYRGYKKAMFEIGAVWGVKAWLPKYIVGIAG